MADVALLALALLTIVLSLPLFGDTKNVLRLDVAAGLLSSTWLLPQAYVLRNDPFSWYYDLSFTYFYIFVCLLLLAFGSWLGRRAVLLRLAQPETELAAPVKVYDSRKLANAALFMTALGGAAFVLMAGQAQNFGLQDQWTGVITFYFLLSQFLVFGGTLGILTYVQHREKLGLIAYIAMAIVALAVVALFVRRSVLFQIATVTLGAVTLNTKLRIPKVVLIAGLAISVLILNGAGAIRQHVFYEGGTIVSAFTEGVVFNSQPTNSDVAAAELKSAVSDIDISRRTNTFKPFVMLWNHFVSQYIPSFVVGEDYKASLIINDVNSTVIQSYSADGATRTGFAESFSGYWYFGPLIYLGIGVLFGRLWVFTNRRDIRAQQIYLIFLLYSLLTITESISRIVVISPIILGAIWLAFKYAERPVAEPDGAVGVPAR